MTTTTPTYGFPKPEATDPYGQGWDAIGDLADAVEARIAAGPNWPRAHVRRNAALNLANGTWTAVGYDTTVAEVGAGAAAMHDPTGSPDPASRVVVPEAGLYRLHGSARFAIGGGGFRGAQLRKNAGGNVASGSYLLHVLRTPSGNYDIVNSIVEADLLAGDYVELFAYQSSGGVLALDVGDPFYNFLHVRKVASS